MAFFIALFLYICDIMAVRQSTIRLHTDIKKDFEKMSNIQEYGVQKFTTAYILNHIARKYYKSAKTIENIVFNRKPLPVISQMKISL